MFYKQLNMTIKAKKVQYVYLTVNVKAYMSTLKVINMNTMMTSRSMVMIILVKNTYETGQDLMVMIIMVTLAKRI